ncbi:MAG: hypothetical protein K8R85_09335 [Bacteroidetes bacterium]|nr:hypothetical protein [Bacteroidota bacterium]
MTINTKDIIEVDLNKIRTNSTYSNFPKSFLFPETIIQNALLFIGINPSSAKDQIEYDSYNLEQKNNVLPYYRKFENIAEECGMAWTHLDLLFFRETRQNYIKEILTTENGVNFIWEQLKIADNLIKISTPKIIVVCNTQARTFLGKDKQNGKDEWLNYDFKFDDNYGTYFWEGIPVFFSGMLSGQRALDIGSYERLKWHIRKVKSQIENYKLNKI